MSYAVTVSFDLHHHASAEDYHDAYAELAKLQIFRQAVGEKGNVVQLTNTTCLGYWDAPNAVICRDVVQAKIKAAFQAKGFSFRLNVFVGDNWAWGCMDVDQPKANKLLLDALRILEAPKPQTLGGTRLPFAGF